MNARIPSSTYRLQLNRDFPLPRALEILGYLHQLGISDCYTSPLAQARPGSQHGYDVINHGVLNPELGGEEAFRQFASRARQFGLGLIVDTVPNHMCINDAANRWWFDVLENGPSSSYAAFFDVDWHPPKDDLRDKVLLPVLGDQYGRVLENQEITITYKDGGFTAQYYDLSLPLAPRSWTWILDPVQEDLERQAGESDREVMELASIITALNHLPLRSETDPAKVRERQREKEVIKTRLATLVESSGAVRTKLDESLRKLNGTRGDPHSFDRLERLLADQAYRLAFWQVAADEINFRRFFDVNHLAAIRVEDPEVFKAVHEVTLRLIRDGLITGLRIDHVDGLRDPGQYLRTLQAECAAACDHDPASALGDAGGAAPGSLPFYVLVEKILGAEEPLRTDWPIHGTTGYEFLNDLNGVFIDSANHARFDALYTRFTAAAEDFRNLVYDCKRLVLRASMSGEQNVLARKLDRISEQHRWSRDFTLNSLGRVLAEVIACFPVYRSYVTCDGRVAPEDRRYIVGAINAAKRKNPALSESTFDFLASVLLLVHPEEIGPAERDERLDFTLRFQQLTSPVMAKGFEDTALYRYYPLASANEVGGDPARFGATVPRFHLRNARRLSEWPHALSATATHDTKRGEDVRALINVLSEIPDEWEQAVRRWHELNAAARVEIEGAPAPDAMEEYLLYQTLVGAWPLMPMTSRQHAEVVKRMQDYMNKAAKEAKLRTSWVSPNHHHDHALAEFIRLVLRAGPTNSFLRDFVSFREPVARAGMLNALAQALLKIGSPGVPDFFQGNELWDQSLVDPDNRRPVDFNTRRAMLEEISSAVAKDPQALLDRLLADPRDGRIKMYVICRALNFRRENAKLFAKGNYISLDATGERQHHIIAFARSHSGRSLIIAAGRFFMRLGTMSHQFPDGRAWTNTSLLTPSELGSRYVDLLTGGVVETRMKRIPHLAMDEVFARMPLAMLVADEG
jgi:(1->4)-alpha-D-glucan 1-alpha-D-glucosylmutase